MTAGLRTVIYPVRDLAAAKRFYGEILGVEPVMDEPWYVGYHVGGQDVGLDPHGHQNGMTGPVAYWHVDDLAAVLDRLVAGGATVLHPTRDIGGGKLLATLVDADGNPLGLVQNR